jgi:hypothetical protein
MKETIAGRICCEGTKGPFYEVLLHEVPCVGELIELTSLVEFAERKPQKHHYKVVQVVHEVFEVSKKIPQSKGGRHVVDVFVKPASSKLFRGAS